MRSEPRHRILICGTGSAAHVLAAVLAESKHWQATLVSLSHRGAAFKENIERDGLRYDDSGPEGRSFRASSEGLEIVGPETLSSIDADIIVMAIPAFAHETYLSAVLPHCHDDVMVILMPAYGWADLVVRHIWKAQTRPPRLHVALMEQLPWVCRTQDFGQSVRVFAHKRTLGCAVMQFGDDARPQAPDPNWTDILQDLMRTVYQGQLRLASSPPAAVAISLFNPNAMMHAALMFGFYKCSDGEGFSRDTFREPPPFYAGVSFSAAAQLDAMSAEVLQLKQVLLEAVPDWAPFLAGVSSFHDWIKTAYANTIENAATTETCLQTNRATRSLPHPMIQGDDGQYRPDFTHRYLTEDVPYGLLALKSLADTARIPTPALNEVIDWAQSLFDPEVTKAASARTLQRFNISTLDELQRYYSASSA